MRGRLGAILDGAGNRGIYQGSPCGGTPMVSFLRTIADSVLFQRFILGVIVAAGVLVGLETDAGMMTRHGRLLHVLDWVILWIFAAELTIKIGARGRDALGFFRDPWNVFDFVIVAICFLPLHAQFAAVLRLVRVLRVLRLVSALPRLQILVGALLKSIPSMGYVAVLLILHFYIYAVIGVSLLGKGDPEHFGSLGRAMLTLFQIVTLEGWADIMRGQFEAGVVARWPVVAYFITFILLGTMIILNLLIGVIMNGMQEAATEAQDAERARHERTRGAPSLGDDLVLVERSVDELKRQLEAIRKRVGKT